MALVTMAGPSNVRAILFDAAGTLIRPREPVGDTYARLARQCGVTVSATQIERAFRAAFRRMPPMVFPGESAQRTVQLERAWWRDLVAATFRTAADGVRFGDFDHYFTHLFEYYAEPQAWEALPHAHATLRALRQRGLHIGIVSNFDHRLRSILAGLELTPLLDVLITPADAGAAKPDPRIFAVALARLGIPASQALYVGDDVEHDVYGARAAGLHAIVVDALPSLSALLDRLESTPPLS